MSQLGSILTSDLSGTDKVVEENYTRKYLDDLGEAVEMMTMDEEDLNPYVQFYLQSPKAGYAFYILACIFKKIDALMDVSNKADQSPWEYFSSKSSFKNFSKAIEALTNGVSQGTMEPAIIQQIRKADRSRMRRVMLKRITDLEPGCLTLIDGQMLDYLTDRNSFFDDFLKVIYIKRGKKQSSDVAGLRQRKSKRVGGSRHETELSGALASNSHVFETGERIENSNLHELASQLFVKLKSPPKDFNWKKAKSFTGSTGTVFSISIICLMTTTALASRALFLSLSAPQLSNATASDLFALLQQNILSLFSQYVLVLPYLRGMKLDNKRFWFLASLIASTLTAVTSIFVYRISLPVSTFLGFISNATQVIATLLLIQEDALYRSANPVSPIDHVSAS